MAISSSYAFVGLLALGLCSCGGPSTQAKAANAIQTLLASGAEAFLMGGGQSSVSVPCSGGGSLGYNGAPAVIDPVQGRFDFDVIFNDCKIKVCGDEITFQSSTGSSKLSLSALDPSQAAELIGGGAIVGSTDQFLEIGVIALQQHVRGFLEGKLDFAYRMRIIGNKNGLKKISIVESPDGDPVSVHGQELPADKLAALADRC